MHTSSSTPRPSIVFPIFEKGVLGSFSDCDEDTRSCSHCSEETISGFDYLTSRFELCKNAINIEHCISQTSEGVLDSILWNTRFLLIGPEYIFRTKQAESCIPFGFDSTFRASFGISSCGSLTGEDGIPDFVRIKFYTSRFKSAVDIFDFIIYRCCIHKLTFGTTLSRSPSSLLDRRRQQCLTAT
jgi:hypothetical protein